MAKAQNAPVSFTDEEKAWKAEHHMLRLGVGIAFPPFMWVENENGKQLFKGMVSDYVDLLGKKLGMDMQIVFGLPFDEALALGRTGRIDLFPCISRTPERSEFLLFTEPYLSYPLVIITREDAPIIGDVKDLGGKRFATVKHLVVYSKMRNEYSHLNLNYVFTKKVEENLEAVSLDRADACIINLGAASYYIQKKGLTNLRIAAPVNWEGVQLAMGIRKDWPILQGIIEKGLASISQEEKDRISQKWIRSKYEPGVPIGKIWRWSLGIALVIFVFFVLISTWNRQLRKEIVEREKAENDLKESERKLTTLIGNLPGIAYRCLNDKNWTMIYISDGCKTLTGYKPLELIENNVLAYGDLIVPDDRRYIWNEIQMAINENRSFTIEYRIQDKNKNEKWVWEKGRCVAESKGNKPVLEGFISDITERKRSETLTLKEKNRAEQYLQLAGVMFIGLDKDGNVTVANKKACNILECNEIDLIGQNWFDNFIPRRIRYDVRSVFRQLINGNIEPVEYYENPIISKSGKEKQIAWHNTFITDEDGIIIGILGSGEDVTEKIKLQAQLQQAQKMESIGNLAGGIAHDFNNILSSIIGFAELALDDVEKDSIIEDNLQEVYTAGKRAKNLVSQILAFARQSEEKVKPIQVDIIVKEVLNFMRSSIPTTIEIKQNIYSDSLIMGNQTQVHQIMMNLCTNAAHAMEDNGGTLSVNLKDIIIDKDSGVKELDLKFGDYIEVSVSDNGTGIAPDIIESVFEPYFTTKDPGEGTGMGLAMVHGIVESYGGKIAVNSKLGKGSTFTIYLPVTCERKLQRQYKPELLPTGSERVLFIDDEGPIAKMGSQGLERLGYQVTTRTSSVEALELFKAKPNAFDLIISDMTMPNITGDILAVEMLKIRPDIPIILCTGYSKKISDETASEIGIKAFAYKPIVKADLAKTVRKVLDAGPQQSVDPAASGDETKS